MKAETLEVIIKGCDDPETRAVAYAALTLTRILAPEWTHIVKNRETDQYETVNKSAGITVGDRESLQKRLDAHIKFLSEKFIFED